MSEEKIIENEVVETENKAVEETTEIKEEVVTMTEEEKNNENLSIYNKVRVVPDSAKREIQGGKLKGFTDINPMWRIKTLTEVFGVCGFGWKVNIIEKWLEENDTALQFITSLAPFSFLSNSQRMQTM